MKIRFTGEADADFATLVTDLVDGEHREAAAQLGVRLFEVFDKLGRGDFEGPRVRLITGQRVHTWPVPPVRIYYVRHPDYVRIIRIYHQVQRPITR